LQFSAMFTMTKELEREWEFDCRCQNVASYLHAGKSVTITVQQLKFYGVTPHQALTVLAQWVKAEEAEECWEAETLYRGYREVRTWVVYCTKNGDKYVFRAKTKS